MFPYIVAFTAICLFLINPISQYLSPPSSPSQRRRIMTHSPRPKLDESLLALPAPNDTSLKCSPDAYGARILSREPLVVYLEGFLIAEEREHLLEISEPIFEPSTITHDASSTSRDTTVRDSSVALIPRTPTVRCIERRALAFQGHRKDVFLERLRTQQYLPGGHYSHHFDWSANVGGWGRVSSMMVWVDDGSGDLVGGGTEFPLLEIRGRDDESGICNVIECGRDSEDVDAGTDGESGGGGDGGGATRVEHASAEGSSGEQQKGGTLFKPIPGNAVYWENFAPDGRGYDETWHAGLPVKKGSKVGLNIWSFGRIE